MTRVADFLFGRVDIGDTERVPVLSKQDYEQARREQERLRRQLQAEVRPWVESSGNGA